MKKLEDRPEYSRLIVELRKKAHMTQEQLAEESGVPVTVIKKIELGIYMPPYSTIVKIANVLGGNPEPTDLPVMKNTSIRTLNEYKSCFRPNMRLHQEFPASILTTI